jgi:hypothetical protein
MIRCMASRRGGSSTVTTTKDPLIIMLTIVAAITFGQMIGFGVGAPWYSELFAAPLRYTGASLGFQIGAAIRGGTTPFAAATPPRPGAAPSTDKI